jgi:phosphoribosylformylglycinamidine synthase subunit PurL
LAVTNCLNFGSPEDPEVMWQFSETVRGLADACLELGLPVTGGNVSFYNQTGSVAILPTPVIGVLGVVEDVTKRTPMGIKPGQEIYVIGKVDDNFSGSEWAHIHGKQIGDRSPVADLDMEKRLVSMLLEGQPIFEAAHDISNGGFAASISEMVLRTNVGATISLEGNVAAELLSETPGRVIIAINESNTNAILALASKYQIPVKNVGVTGGDSLTINGGALSIDELGGAHTGVLEALFG